MGGSGAWRRFEAHAVIESRTACRPGGWMCSRGWSRLLMPVSQMKSNRDKSPMPPDWIETEPAPKAY